MSDFAVRPVEDSEHRAASNLFLGALHTTPLSDERWPYFDGEYQPGRVLGAYADKRLIGTTLSWASGLVVPGGAVLPMAAVSGVGVRADHTRRGVLTELMGMQLTAIAESGEVLAALHASEPVIYGRFGYGLGTIARITKVQRRRAVLRPEVPKSGEVRLLDIDAALATMPATYDRAFGHRPGMMRRPAGWWRMAYESRLRTGENVQVAVHTGPDGPDGFLAYTPREHQAPDAPFGSTVLRVVDFNAANQAAANDLWRFLLGVDLVDEIVAFLRPLDEPLEAMLVNQRAVKAEFDEDLWIRLVDVPAALAGRAYGDAEPVVIEVRDRQLPANSGRYLIGPHGTERGAAPADLAMDADVLASIYLGSVKPSVLAGIGRIQVTNPEALPRADRLFATEQAAWCGTMF